MTTPEKERLPPPPAMRELDEILRPDATRPRELARQLFAHGLLCEAAEVERPLAKERREARIRAILDRLQPPAGEPPRRRAASRLELFVAAAAVVAAALLWFARPGAATPIHAERLLERARRNTESGVHVFEVELDTILRRRGKRRERGLRYRSTWLAALAPGRRWNARKITGSYPLVRGTELGSDGETMWVKAPNGYAFDLFMDPKGIEVTALQPVLAYYQLRPFLETVLRDLDLEVVSRQGGRVRLAGSYEYERVPPRRMDPSQWIRNAFFGDRGRIELTLAEDTGALLELDMVQGEPAPGRIRVTRRKTIADLEKAGFDFDPPRVRVKPNMKFWHWLRVLAAAWRRARR